MEIEDLANYAIKGNKEDVEDYFSFSEDTEKEVQKNSIVATSKEKKNKRKSFSLYHILGGDILAGKYLKNHIPHIFVTIVLVVLYISNRYGSEQELRYLERLQDSLQIVQFNALSQTSLLLEKTRQSKILDYLNSDTTEALSVVNPYVISNP